uniref:C2H2-type domain-containing protein n=1 Tax=Pristionchus pacificus TaxID=54126 RepID=A0A8R1YVZ6_PRIPA
HKSCEVSENYEEDSGEESANESSDEEEDSVEDDESLDGTAKRPISFNCKICGKSYKWKGCLRNHIRDTHHSKPDPNQRNACKFILMTTRKNYSNALNVKMDSQMKRNLRNICRFIYVSYVTFTYEGYSATNRQYDTVDIEERKIFKCDECDRRFLSKSTLSRHKITHSEDPHQHKNNFKCDECGIRCYTSSAITDHTRTHLRQFFGVSFVSFRNKKKNVFFSAENDPRRRLYKCKTCGKHFTGSSAMNAHKLTHLDHIIQYFGALFFYTDDKIPDQAAIKRPAKCKECGIEVTSAAVLRRHMKIHSGNNSQFNIRIIICISTILLYILLQKVRKQENDSSVTNLLTILERFITNVIYVVRRIMINKLSIITNFLISSNCDIWKYIHPDDNDPDQTAIKRSCNLCGKGFQKQKYLNQHMYQHNDFYLNRNSLCASLFSGNYPFKCDFCSTSTKTSIRYEDINGETFFST